MGRGGEEENKRKTGQVYFMFLISMVELEYVRQSILIFARPFPWLIFLGRLVRVHWGGASHIYRLLS